jgi:quinol monooxygenase YgiN
MTRQEITFIIECKVRPGRASEFDLLVPVLEAAANQDPGTIEYRWYVGPTPTARDLYERYRDSEATLAHIEALGKDLTQRYLQTVQVRSVIMIGPASDELRAQLAPFFDGSVPDVSAAWYRSSYALRSAQPESACAS